MEGRTWLYGIMQMDSLLLYTTFYRPLYIMYHCSHVKYGKVEIVEIRMTSRIFPPSHPKKRYKLDRKGRAEVDVTDDVKVGILQPSTIIFYLAPLWRQHEAKIESHQKFINGMSSQWNLSMECHLNEIYQWDVISMKFINGMSSQWNLSMECHLNEIYQWNVISMKFINGMSSQWNLSMECHLNEILFLKINLRILIIKQLYHLASS